MAGMECDNYYQISDDDLDDCEDLPDDCLLEETDGPISSHQAANSTHTRGPYERAWTTEATRALIHIRGPMEHRFTEGRQKRTALWLHCTRQLQKMGFRYSAGKVQKKWHNILITYNKNLSKKYTSGYVHWEFFEEMFKYLQGKKADFAEHSSSGKRHNQQRPANAEGDNSASPYLNANSSEPPMIQPHVEIDSKSNDDFDEEDSTTLSDLKKPKVEVKDEEEPQEIYPLEIADSNSFLRANAKLEQPDKEANQQREQQFALSEIGRSGNGVGGGSGAGVSMDSSSASWWQNYFERKLQVERDKIDLQKEMHRELMQFNKMSLLQQEKIERIKIEAINNLTSTLQKLVEVKYKKL
ncbi:uncharacterized protein LOC106085175 isoform X2 [Stomoxys calcitrans]|uniref:Myb/SANT-like DNA-binding domain-containing protein n=1 Tax=Stomoxys calcitrans TaxID=35570 RepID=A0A1I8P8L1_STOCA|nr:uncharacterized protein LOC106085175 isoform X2 [Stomoxys calcitrans]